MYTILNLTNKAVILSGRVIGASDHITISDAAYATLDPAQVAAAIAAATVEVSQEAPAPAPAPGPAPDPVPPPAPAPNPVTIPTPVAHVIGHSILHVVEYGGADPTGAVEATAAFQKAIDALPQPFGGTVYVPAGNYLIDPVVGVKLRSNTCLDMDPAAVLLAKPNGATNYGVLAIKAVTNVLVTGGTIKGDRDTHTFTPQKSASKNTHEWGHGVQLFGSSHVTIRDTVIKECTGDGISLSSTGKPGEAGYLLCGDVFILNVTSSGNRRQGISVGKSDTVLIQGGNINNIGKVNGTLPMDGIDIEPDAGAFTRNVYIDGVTIENNVKNGIEGNSRTSPIDGVHITNCTIRFNGGAGTYMAGINGLDSFNNTIVGNAQTGSYISTTCKQTRTSGNTYGGNYNRGTLPGKVRAKPFTQVGVTAAIDMDILAKNPPAQNDIGSNYYI